MIEPGRIDLTIYQGATFRYSYIWRSGAPAGGITIRGTVATIEGLPASGRIGDAWFVSAVGSPAREEIYCWESSGWRELERVDLTGWAALLVIRRSKDSAAAIITLSSANGDITLGGETGEILLDISADHTAALVAGVGYPFDLKVWSPEGGYVGRLLEGEVTVSGEVSRLESSIHQPLETP